MGNYCCSQQQAQKNLKLKKKITVDLTPRTTNLSARFSLGNQPIQKTIQKDSLMSPSTMSAKCFDILCQQEPLAKGGQASIYEMNAELSKKYFSDSTIVIQDSPLVVRKIKKSIASLNQQEPLSIKLMMANNCPFIVKGIQWFNQEQYIFQVMQKQIGGDLSSFLENTLGKGDSFRQLGDQGLRMVLAGIILGLQYIHSNNIIYCDLKLENVVVSKDGYPVLIDFDLSCDGPTLKSSQFKGTPIYTAPQVFQNEYIDKGVDLWALGILTYMLVYGEPPFEQQDINGDEFPSLCKRKQGKYFLKRKKASIEIINFINSILKFKSKDRLGYENMNQLKNHSFFTGFDWIKYQKKQMCSPLKKIVNRFSIRKTSSQFEEYSHVDVDDLFLPKKQNHLRKTKCNISAKSSIDNERHIF